MVMTSRRQAGIYSQAFAKYSVFKAYNEIKPVCQGGVKTRPIDPESE